MTALALFPHGFTRVSTAGEVVVDHVFPLLRGADKLALVAVGLNDLLFIEGWATTAGVDRRTADAVYLNIDKIPTIAAAYGHERLDVASVHGQSIVRCGYRGIVPIARMGLGFHAISASVIDFEKAVYYTSPETQFLIVDPRLRAVPSESIRLQDGTDADSAAAGADGAPTVIYGARVRIRGTVSNALRSPPPVAVVLAVDDASIIECSCVPAGSNSGDDSALAFEAVFGSELLGGGSHAVRAIAMAADGTAIGESVNAFAINVAESLR